MFYWPVHLLNIIHNRFRKKKKDHTEIRVYGCDLAPYKMSKYLPVKIFALKYIRHMINSDDIHFVAFKKKQQLRIKGHTGSFIFNIQATGEEENKMLK